MPAEEGRIVLNDISIAPKAYRAGWRMTEVPSRWEDRTEGQSKFKLWRWLPRYLRWYGYTLTGIPALRRATKQRL